MVASSKLLILLAAASVHAVALPNAEAKGVAKQDVIFDSILYERDSETYKRDVITSVATSFENVLQSGINSFNTVLSALQNDSPTDAVSAAHNVFDETTTLVNQLISLVGTSDATPGAFKTLANAYTSFGVQTFVDQLGDFLNTFFTQAASVPAVSSLTSGAQTLLKSLGNLQAATDGNGLSVSYTNAVAPISGYLSVSN